MIAICFGITETNLIRKVGCIDKELEEIMAATLEKSPIQRYSCKIDLDILYSILCQA